MIKKYFDSVRYRDLRELIDRSADKYGDKIAIREFNSARQIIDHSYNQLRADSTALGVKLVADGWKGKHFALVGESSYNYLVCYLAVTNWVGVIIPLDRELSSDELAKQIGICDASAVFYASSLTAKMDEILPQCSEIKLAINMTTALESLVAAGRKLLDHKEKIDLDTEVDADKNCTIIFTSGTTGANKGVMLCHRNIVTVIHSGLSMFDKAQTYFSLLPINHTVELNLFVLGNISGGTTVCFNDGLKFIKENLTIFKPDICMMVPMLVDHLYKNIWKEAEKSKQASRLKFGIFASNFLRFFGIDIRARLFAPILEGLGGNLRQIFCGGAPLTPELVKGFAALGINIYNGYGITECSPFVSSNSQLSQVPGSVGAVAPDCQIRLGEVNADGNGEIQVKGDNVMLGYYKDPAGTKRTFTEDGWFKTGDIGRLDKYNNLYITGRVKNLIIRANGKNVHPEELEECLLNQIPYLKEVVVFAPKNEKGNDLTISAKAFLDPEFTLTIGLEKAAELFKIDVEKVNRHLAGFKRITQILIRETEFEKTTTKKIKRDYSQSATPGQAALT